MTNPKTGELQYSADRGKLNRDRIRDIITISYTVAECWPAQVRLLIPKGMYACGILQAFAIPWRTFLDWIDMHLFPLVEDVDIKIVWWSEHLFLGEFGCLWIWCLTRLFSSHWLRVAKDIAPLELSLLADSKGYFMFHWITSHISFFLDIWRCSSTLSHVLPCYFHAIDDWRDCIHLMNCKACFFPVKKSIVLFGKNSFPRSLEESQPIKKGAFSVLKVYPPLPFSCYQAYLHPEAHYHRVQAPLLERSSLPFLICSQ